MPHDPALGETPDIHNQVTNPPPPQTRDQTRASAEQAIHHQATLRFSSEGQDGQISYVPPAIPGYELGAEIARGGMGVVYQAHDLAIKRTVAVKLLQDKYPVDSPVATRFLEEAQITGQLQHPGIPPIYQVGKLADGGPFLAMKLIKGQTLNALLKAGTPINKLAVIEAIAQAVGYAHAHGVIHRDLKPQNVMVGAFGEVQVMDWGLAKVLAEAQAIHGGREEPRCADTFHDPRSGSEGSQTEAGSILGTPAYMPPEQAKGELDQVDQRSDVFGLGAILCQMLTGRPPYDVPDPSHAR